MWCAKNILKYFQNIKDLGISYSKNKIIRNEKLIKYCDSGFADINIWKSTSM